MKGEAVNYKITREDCRYVIQSIIEIFGKVIEPSSFDLIVYGSYATGKWRAGVSDIDGILYLNQGSFLETISRRQIREIQRGIRNLYEKFPFSKKAIFFADFFILDKFHGNDGRFMIYDEGFIQRLLVVNKNYSVAWGNDFLKDLSPVSLRHQEEFQLAMYLQEIRKFLLFEIPKLTSENQFGIPEVYKFLKVLPRFIHIVLNRPINSIDEGLKVLSQDLFLDIDYGPLCELTGTETKKYLKSWCGITQSTFIDCWQCYEKTLEHLVAYAPMRSLK